jgi:hypothetical protein
LATERTARWGTASSSNWSGLLETFDEHTERIDDTGVDDAVGDRLEDLGSL